VLPHARHQGRPQKADATRQIDQLRLELGYIGHINNAHGARLTTWCGRRRSPPRWASSCPRRASRTICSARQHRHRPRQEIEAGRSDKTAQIRVELQPPLGVGKDGGRDAAPG